MTMQFRPVREGSSKWVWSLVVLTGGLLLLVIWLVGRTAWGITNLGYDLTPTDLVIRFGATTERIPRADIADVQVYEQLSNGRRLAGTAMPGLFEGRWSFAETGRITLYATVQENLVVVKMADGKQWGITPADPRAFVDDLISGRTQQWPPAEGAPPWAGLAMLGFTVPLMLFINWLILYYIRLPQVMLYTLDENDLVISGGRLNLRLPYREIETVELAQPKGAPWRTWGAGMPGLYWGYFSWKAAGGSLRLYATRIKPLVLVTAGGKRYGITPEDQGHFVAELARRLA